MKSCSPFVCQWSTTCTRMPALEGLVSNEVMYTSTYENHKDSTMTSPPCLIVRWPLLEHIQHPGPTCADYTSSVSARRENGPRLLLNKSIFGIILCCIWHQIFGRTPHSHHSSASWKQQPHSSASGEEINKLDCFPGAARQQSSSCLHYTSSSPPPPGHPPERPAALSV